MTVRTWWSRRRRRPVPPSREARHWQAAVSAADWCVTRAYHGGYSGVPYEVTVEDVRLCADQDFGRPDVTADQAAAAIRQRWYARRCGWHLQTDAFDRADRP
ncbi:hypothetical protein [Streptomyces sp. NPDC089919]|uniref:hypothetical protein n=1 Tax=Streptomyces sp. NPDC089919 TaxID=3155188 RepID=UPI003434C3C3